MKNIVPVYYQIKEILKNWILEKKYHPGKRIPSVEKLSKHFKVSHLTVRQAIGQLEQEGFLTCKRGSGTFVSENEDLFNSLRTEITGFMDEILYQVQKAKTKTAEISVIKTPDIIAEKLKLDADEKEVYKIDRVRLLHDNYFNYSTNYVPMRIGKRISEKELYRKPFLQILEQDLKIEFDEAVQVIQATFASQDIAEKLHILPGSPMLFIERILYGKEKRPIQMLHAHYRGDLYKYIVRLKNFPQKSTNVWIHQDRLKE